MNTYETELGYIVFETLGGLEVYEDDTLETLLCTLDGKTLDSYREDPDDDLSDINDDLLEADIKNMIEVEEFIAYQDDYC